MRFGKEEMAHRVWRKAAALKTEVLAAGVGVVSGLSQQRLDQLAMHIRQPEVAALVFEG